MAPTPTVTTTTITSHGEVDITPSEIYGDPSGPVAFRLGNGGAGPTGILRTLSELFLSLHAPHAQIPWVCNHSRNTQLALLKDAIDVSLTYERDQEEISVREGWARKGGVVFHDHFVVVGPRSNPANLLPTDSPTTMLSKIHVAASAGLTTFHSRVDGSATMVKERALWSASSLSPWTDPVALGSWYKTSLLPPASALIGADTAGAYLLSDRSTLLRQTANKTIQGSTVFYEPGSPDDFLMNGCAALIAAEPIPMAVRFVEFLHSDEGQKLIRTYGNDEVGQPFFALLTPSLKPSPSEAMATNRIT
ncbi:hypothetical protein MNV49_007509 [Pseudohyphozyma bogoriensis]|nr:hypothetical protein MNV49_007509 [Pseudohyphozyma bogoriensis]